MIAQNNLGTMYATGEGVPRDLVEAYKWFTLAAERQTKQESEATARNLDALTSKMTAEQVAAGRQRAHDWMPGNEKR